MVHAEDQDNSKGNGGTSSSSFVVIGENHTAGRRAIELNLQIESKLASSKVSSVKERIITEDAVTLSKTPKFGKGQPPQDRVVKNLANLCEKLPQPQYFSN